jgi:formylglycine-generating enzyme required for sulfatase activity
LHSAHDWILSLDDAGHHQQVTTDELPLTIGGGEDDRLRLAGWPPAALQVGVLEGRFFVSPNQKHVLSCNGEPLRDTRWLSDRDVIASNGRVIECSLREQRLQLVSSGHGSAGETLPPDLDALARQAGATVAPRAGPRPETIAAVEYRARQPVAAPSRRRPSAPVIALWSGLLILLVAAWFAFTAKSVRLLIEPEPQAVTLPSTWLKFRIGERWLLRSGEHLVVAERDGYRRLEELIEVGVAPDQQMRLRMQRLPGRITIATQPETGGQVFIDDAPAGELPFLDAEVEHGARRFRIEAPRFLPAEAALEVEGAQVAQTLSVDLVPNWAPVTVTSRPAGAQISIDGEEVARTPATVELEAGERRIELSLPGYTAWSDAIQVRPGEPAELDTVGLREADGRIRLASSPVGARVTVNGQYRGQTPLTVTLPPGREHDVVVAMAGYESARRRLSVQADSGRQLQVELQPVYGEVRLDVLPTDAEVRVAGRSLGTDRVLNLQAVQQTLEIRRNGYATQRVEVTPRPGFTQELEVRLLTEEEAREAAIQRTITTATGAELRLLEVGRFTMGSPRNEQGRRSNEVQRPVELTRRFYLGTRAVTNAEFRAFRSSHDSGRFSGESLNGDDQPVVNVSWNDAVEFLNWLSARDNLPLAYERSGTTWVLSDPVGIGYRLPTEAEWEWAARHLSRAQPARFAWGDALPPPDRSGNLGDVSAARLLPNTLVTYNDGFPVSAPVGSFQANPAGLHDMGGNVAEWVHDFYSITPPADASERVSDPLGPESGRFRVVRGASWKHASITELRLTYRDYSDRMREDVGFRIARYLE